MNGIFYDHNHVITLFILLKMFFYYFLFYDNILSIYFRRNCRKVLLIRCIFLTKINTFFNIYAYMMFCIITIFTYICESK